MKPRRWLDLGALLVLALIVRLLTAWLLRQPGYTDAYYYAVGAQQLHAGQGFTEPFIWNYLDPPASLPHPGYLYWMPLTAMLGWLGLEILGESFRAIQAPFVLVSALLPLMAYTVTWDLTGRRKHALLAGALAVFVGFYAHVFVLPDNFAPFALGGSLCLWAAGRGLRNGQVTWFGLAGVAAGVAHLARADGALLLGVTWLAATAAKRLPTRAKATGIASSLAGYLLVMGPWFVRNWQAVGTPLAGAGFKTLFLTTYDDIFGYQPPLNLKSYLAWGWGAILQSKAEALWLNLQRLWAENLLIFLLPLTAMGLWVHRRERLIQPFLLYLPLLFVAMTFAFTFPGSRGGLFHSGGALLPFFFAAAGPGLDAMLRWAARRFPGWQADKAWSVFSVGAVAMAVLVTLLALARAGVLDGDWNKRDWGYAEIGQWLDDQGAAEATVMVGNAPGFTWHTGHPAIAVPNEPLDTVLSVADDYAVRYLLLDSTRPRFTDALYDGQINHPQLVRQHIPQLEGQAWQLYKILP
ncbi:MAG: glycosyltransferase family 39 protein [Anaerolineae bacterium]|jgi:hypothetical protein